MHTPHCSFSLSEFRNERTNRQTSGISIVFANHNSLIKYMRSVHHDGNCLEEIIYCSTHLACSTILRSVNRHLRYIHDRHTIGICTTSRHVHTALAPHGTAVKSDSDPCPDNYGTGHRNGPANISWPVICHDHRPGQLCLKWYHNKCQAGQYECPLW